MPAKGTVVRTRVGEARCVRTPAPASRSADLTSRATKQNVGFHNQHHVRWALLPRHSCCGMPKPQNLRSMSDFDPSNSSLMHNQLNDDTFEWGPPVPLQGPVAVGAVDPSPPEHILNSPSAVPRLARATARDAVPPQVSSQLPPVHDHFRPYPMHA